ncbi:hypothetical protein ACT3SP_00600 [Brachybacterium sp. AOP43-C2-M15]|uniref:hypothetical protein n=1 Tax=Brachybacterium sp. AOP43-C2-M15 TaxID=3457661 RepID=UPI004033F0BD
MRDATIATSRTRATADQLIDYRPLPAEWGDLEALQAQRAEKARAAARGLDPSTLEIAVATTGAHRAPAAPRRPRGHGLLASLRRQAGAHRRRGHAGGRLATA